MSRNKAINKIDDNECETWSKYWEGDEYSISGLNLGKLWAIMKYNSEAKVLVRPIYYLHVA